MDRHIPHDYTTSNVLAWTATQSANAEPLAEEDASADVDEPPDCRSPRSPKFSRTPVRRGSEQHESLLTKALQSHSENEGPVQRPVRRRSITSNFSLSSGDLTCDTGLTTPARTSSPSPKLPNVGFVPITTAGKRVAVAPKPGTVNNLLAGNTQPTRNPAMEVLQKKRCISFACAANPKADDKMLMPPPPKPTAVKVKLEEVPKKRCIQFACTARVPSTTSMQQRGSTTPTGRPVSTETSSKLRPSRSPVVRRTSRSPHPAQSKKWLAANPKDLESECSRFHEFASDEHQEDDWILRDNTSTRPKITINDTLKKENEFRKIGKEAEEEADQEEEEDDENDLGDDGDENDGEDDDEGDDVDAGSDDGSDKDSDDGGSDDDADEKRLDRWDDASDGYKTDNEVGFADSDEEDDGLELWTAFGQRSFSGATAIHRRSSTGHHSDSSDDSRRIAETIRAKRRQKRTTARPPTPELPDSTDFVCGTLDEDRPLEEAYISHLAARKQNKLHLIPQDIDPSFPTSEPEDEGEELYKKGYGDSEDQVWLHGELEDIHHDRERTGRRGKSDAISPKRMRSPPPKQRRHSPPPPKARGRSPRRQLERQSPRKFRSPHPGRAASKSPLASVAPDDVKIAFKSLAFRPGLTYTKSLPRGPIMFPHLKPTRRSRANTTTREAHVRGAIDIVKGLEQKRQRRKEKFYQKYCTRARKEKAQGQVKRPLPGQGAQRMREVGLIMAGKVGPGANFVLSI